MFFHIFLFFEFDVNEVNQFRPLYLGFQWGIIRALLDLLISPLLTKYRECKWCRVYKELVLIFLSFQFPEILSFAFLFAVPSQLWKITYSKEAKNQFLTTKDWLMSRIHAAFIKRIFSCFLFGIKLWIKRDEQTLEFS